ncbi:MAG: DUF885 family protein [Gemmatimonadaceae bacterium]
MTLEANPLIAALDAFFQSYYATRPVNATFTGVHDFDGLLPDWSPAGIERARLDMSRLRNLLAHAAPSLGTLGTGSQPDWGLIDATLADAFLDIQLAELETTHFQRGNPSLAVGETAFGLISLMTRPFAPASERAHALRARLDAIPDFLHGAQRTLAAVPQRPLWRDKALRELDGVRILLDRGIPVWCRVEADGVDLAASLQRARDAIETFAQWLRLAPVATDATYGCGEPFLSLLLRRGHWVSDDLESLRRTWRARLVEERNRLTDRAHHEHADGWSGVQAELAVRHPGPDSFYEAFGRIWHDCHDHAVARHLVTWPDYPIRYVPIPSWTRDAAPFLYYLFYRSPARFDQLQPVEYVVTPIEMAATDEERARHLRAWNDSVIKLNHVVHHGAIGHHVQNYYAYRAPSRIGQVAAIDCASRIGMFGGGSMAEGWACYATDLMDEAGFLTPYESVAEQHTRVRMLARAIVDIELHTGRMTLDDAIAFYGEWVGMSPDVARGEAVKNSMFPGTASMYWLGTQGIHALRAQVAERLGTRFDLCTFHDTLLAMGSIPVRVASELFLRQLPSP